MVMVIISQDQKEHIVTRTEHYWTVTCEMSSDVLCQYHMLMIPNRDFWNSWNSLIKNSLIAYPISTAQFEDGDVIL